MSTAQPPPKNLVLSSKGKKAYRPLLIERAIAGTADETILARALYIFFEMIGHASAEPIENMQQAEERLVTYVRSLEPEGLVFTRDINGIADTVHTRHIADTVGFPKAVTDRLVESFRQAYVSAARDDTLVRDVILTIKDTKLAKPTTVWYRFPTEVPSTDATKGFQNVLYTMYYKPKKDDKIHGPFRISGRRNILNDAITGAYTDLVGGKDPEEPASPAPAPAPTTNPADVFIHELARGLGLRVEDDGGLASTGSAITPSILTTAYQTERAPLLALYSDMVLPGEVDSQVIVTAEKLGKLIAASTSAPEQGDIDVIRSELKALDPKKGKRGALLMNPDAIPTHLLVSKPFRPHARKSYVYASRTSFTAGHAMKPLRAVRVR